MRKEKVAVLGFNAGGGCDVWEADVEVSEAEYAEGIHLERAEAMARDNDFESRFAVHVQDELPQLAKRLIAAYPELFRR